MTVDVNVFAVNLPDTDRQQPHTIMGDPFFSSSPSYTAEVVSNFQDATNTASSGVFFTPSVPPNSTCSAFLESYITPNVVQFSNALANNHTFLGIAPWTSVNGCAQAFLSDAGSRPNVAGFIFFLPDAMGPPPAAQSATWFLNGSSDWHAQFQFPVYALAGNTGAQIMSSLKTYASNLTHLTDQPERGWLFAQITPDSLENHLPNIWYFLLIILCVLLGGVAFVSGLMHLIQRRHRRTLQNRIDRGEINIESLGVRRLRVPPEVLAKLPLYTYTTQKGPNAATTQKPVNTSEKPVGTSEEKFEGAGPAEIAVAEDQDGIQASAPAAQDLALTGQDTCAICLDDYEPNTTTVRELPCRHIFHPDCIDPFLRENSNLCPLCKCSVLTSFAGYAPRVTNAMVRRERMAQARRRQAIRTAALRERVSDEAEAGPSGTRPSNRALALAARLPRPLQPLALRHYSQQGRRYQDRPTQSLEMSSDIPQQRQASGGMPLETGPTISRSNTVVPPPGPSRREWARQRAVRMLGPQPTAEEEVLEQERRRPAWRRAIRSVFPSTSAP